MKTQLSALDIHYIIKELDFLIDGKIVKIYTPSKKEIILQFHIPNKGKQQLKIDEKSLYLLENKFPAESPSGFCMYLRKKLTNSRLRKISQIGFERIIELQFETKEETLSLICELFSKGNIILAKDNIILSAAENQEWSDRIIAPKKEYSHPKKEYNLLTLTEQDLINLLKKTDKESIIKTIAIDLGLGGSYSEEVCLIANIDKNQKPSLSDPKKIFSSLNKLLSKEISPRNIYEKNILKDIVPFEMKLYQNLKQEQAPSFNKAIESYFSNEIIIKEESKHEKQFEKIENIISQQNKHIQELVILEQENKLKAEALYHHYQLVSKILAELKEISRKHNWKEIQDKLKNHKLIKQVNPKDKTIVLRL